MAEEAASTSTASRHPALLFDQGRFPRRGPRFGAAGPQLGVLIHRDTLEPGQRRGALFPFTPESTATVALFSKGDRTVRVLAAENAKAFALLHALDPARQARFARNGPGSPLRKMNAEEAARAAWASTS